MYERVRLKYAPLNLKVKGKDFFDLNYFSVPVNRPLFYQFIAELKELCSGAEPSLTHHFLKDLAKEGKLARWYTQNVDSLEERLGLNCWTAATGRSAISQSVVVSLHGTLSQVTCTFCKVTADFTDEHLNLFKLGKEVPCQSCLEASEFRESLGKRKVGTGYLRPDIVLYNEPHPHGETIADFVSADMSRQPNLLLVMGTSLKIPGLKKMIKDFARKMKSGRDGCKTDLVVYINLTPCSRAEWETVFDYELIGKCDSWIKLLGEFRKGHANQPIISSTVESYLIVAPIQNQLTSSTMVNSIASLISDVSIMPDGTESSSSSIPPIRRINKFFKPVKGCFVDSKLFLYFEKFF